MSVAEQTEQVAHTRVEPHGKLALKPPMGWNSWDAFGVSVTEAEVRANAEFMAERLRVLGWEYVVVDLGWYAPQATTSNYKTPGLHQLIDDYGRLVPDPGKFPSAAGGAGFAPLAEYVHSLGLKFGLHIMRGMPWQAPARCTPIMGSSHTADSIAQPTAGCPWFGNSVGIDMARPGSQSYYDSIVQLYAQWGVDFIKADDTNSWDGDGRTSPYRVREVEAIRRAIDNCGRPMVLSLSPGAAQLENADHLRRHANMWRVSYDFWDSWDALKLQFDRCAKWARYVTPGHWPDADMIPLGKVGIRGEIGAARPSNFSAVEQQTLMSLWCIFRSPLMFGGHFPESDDLAISLVSNAAAIRVNQAGAKPREAWRSDDGHARVWISDSPSGGCYAALFNISDEPRHVAVEFGPIGLPSACRVRDIWAGRDVGFYESQFSSTLPPHGSGLYQLFT